MKSKCYSTLLFDSKQEKEKYFQLRSWEEKTKSNLLLAKLTAPKDNAYYYIFRYDPCGNFSILKNKIDIYTSYEHCFAYTQNKAYLSYRKTGDRLYSKGDKYTRNAMLKFLIVKRFKSKTGLDFLKEKDLVFIASSLPLIQKLFSKEITSLNAAWKFYLHYYHTISGNIDYKLIYSVYCTVTESSERTGRSYYIDIFFKFLQTSDNIQRDMIHLSTKRNIFSKFRDWEPMITHSFLMQRKMNYTLSAAKLDIIHSRQMADLLHIKIKHGLLSTEPFIPFLPEIMEFSSNEVIFHLLNNVAAFQEEGLAMKNCIFNRSGFRNSTKEGEALYFSVRNTYNPPLRGTLEVYINGHCPILHQFKSRMNEFDFLRPDNEKLPGSVDFLQTTRSFIEGEEMGSFIKSIQKHFQCIEEQF